MHSLAFFNLPIGERAQTNDPTGGDKMRQLMKFQLKKYFSGSHHLHHIAEQRQNHTFWEVQNLWLRLGGWTWVKSSAPPDSPPDARTRIKLFYIRQRHRMQRMSNILQGVQATVLCTASKPKPNHIADERAQVKRWSVRSKGDAEENYRAMYY